LKLSAAGARAIKRLFDGHVVSAGAPIGSGASTVTGGFPPRGGYPPASH
jgi:hypothetical protein